MYVLVVAISGGDVVATSVVAKSAPSMKGVQMADVIYGESLMQGTSAEEIGR